MELIAKDYRRIVAPVEALALASTGRIFSHKLSWRSIHIVSDCEFHLSFEWNTWQLNALQMFLFDLWCKLIGESIIKYEDNRIRFGPWALTEKRIMYGFNIVEHVVKFRLGGDQYDDYIYSIDGNHRCEVAPDDFRSIIAIAMTVHGSQYLY